MAYLIITVLALSWKRYYVSWILQCGFLIRLCAVVCLDNLLNKVTETVCGDSEWNTFLLNNSLNKESVNKITKKTFYLVHTVLASRKVTIMGLQFCKLKISNICIYVYAVV